MAPDAEDCETGTGRLKVEETTRHGRRILPDRQQPATAWAENEDERPGDNTNSPGENRRLLPSGPPSKHKSRLQAGLTLGVHTPSKYAKVPELITHKTKLKTQFEKRKDKLVSLLRPPYFIVSMIVVIVCIHMWDSGELRATLEWYPVEWWREPWRLLTYGLVHASVPHLALNALVALAVGWPLEREQGWWRVVCVWYGGVAAGALGAGVLQQNVRVVGASAAVYALLTAHIANVCLRFGHIPLWWFRPLSVVVLGTSEMCWALMRAPTLTAVERAHAPASSSSNEYVAWSAHIFGAAIGIPLAFLVFTGENYGKLYVIGCRFISVLVIATGIVLAAIHYHVQYVSDDLDQT